MACLSKHRTHIRHLPEEPFEHFGASRIFRRQELAGLFRQMDEYRARLENRDAGVMIDDRGNLAVRTNLDELRLELIAVANIDWMNRILEPALLEHDCRLAGIWRRPGVKIDHLYSFLRCDDRFLSQRPKPAH